MYATRCSDGGAGPSRVRIPLQPLQVDAHLCRTLIAQVAIFLQSLIDDSLQLGWHRRIQSHGGRGRCVEDGFEDLRRTDGMKRESAGSYLVKHRAEGKQIAACGQ